MGTRSGAGNAPGTDAPPAKGTGKDQAKGGKGAKGSKKNNKRQKKKKKEKLECGENGEYGKLQEKTGGGKFDRDHVPAKQALIERARKFNSGEKLCKEQRTAIIKTAAAIAIPKGIHQQFSATYGGRVHTDFDKQVANPKWAANRDTKQLLKQMKPPKVSKECAKKYKNWAKKVQKMSNRQYDKMLKKAVVDNKRS